MRAFMDPGGDGEAPQEGWRERRMMKHKRGRMGQLILAALEGASAGARAGTEFGEKAGGPTPWLMGLVEGGRAGVKRGMEFDEMERVEEERAGKRAEEARLRSTLLSDIDPRFPKASLADAREVSPFFAALQRGEASAAGQTMRRQLAKEQMAQQLRMHEERLALSLKLGQMRVEDYDQARREIAAASLTRFALDAFDSGSSEQAVIVELANRLRQGDPNVEIELKESPLFAGIPFLGGRIKPAVAPTAPRTAPPRAAPSPPPAASGPNMVPIGTTVYDERGRAYTMTANGPVPK